MKITVFNQATLIVIVIVTVLLVFSWTLTDKQLGFILFLAGLLGFCLLILYWTWTLLKIKNKSEKTKKLQKVLNIVLCVIFLGLSIFFFIKTIPFLRGFLSGEPGTHKDILSILWMFLSVFMAFASIIVFIDYYPAHSKKSSERFKQTVTFNIVSGLSLSFYITLILFVAVLIFSIKPGGPFLAVNHINWFTFTSMAVVGLCFTIFLVRGFFKGSQEPKSPQTKINPLGIKKSKKGLDCGQYSYQTPIYPMGIEKRKKSWIKGFFETIFINVFCGTVIAYIAVRLFLYCKWQETREFFRNTSYSKN